MASEMERKRGIIFPLKRIFKEKGNITQSLIQNFQVQKLCQQSLIANIWKFCSSKRERRHSTTFERDCPTPLRALS